MSKVANVPWPLEVGVTLAGEMVSCPGLMVAGPRAQSVNEALSTLSETAVPVAPHRVAAALVVDTRSSRLVVPPRLGIEPLVVEFPRLKSRVAPPIFTAVG